MRKSKAESLGLPILGALRAYSVVGVPPNIMGIGPAKVSSSVIMKIMQFNAV